MKRSIGLWMDSKLQKQIKCYDNNDLKDIYEKMYTDPNSALNQIRQKIEELFENFFKDHKLGENNFQGRLLSSNKEKGNTKIKEFFLKIFDGNKVKANAELDLIYSYGSLTRVYGNTGSHNGDHNNEDLAQMAIISFMAFFELNKIFNNKTLVDNICEHFNSFIYNRLEVIYETKDDVEEWGKIRFNKLKFNYDLYSQTITLTDKKLDLSNIIEQEMIAQDSNKKNIYFLNLDKKTFHRFKKFHKKLTNDVNEKKYFKTNQEIIEIEAIDTIPLRLLRKDEANPYKWDMCYINLSIEFENFGLDLILFLNFNQEKFNFIKEDYELEIQDLNSLKTN